MRSWGSDVVGAFAVGAAAVDNIYGPPTPERFHVSRLVRILGGIARHPIQRFTPLRSLSYPRE